MKRKVTPERRLQVLDSLGQIMAETRKEAMDWRANCGIEQEWIEDDEFYQGIDDANRHEAGKSSWTKPLATGQSDEPQRPKGSTVFPNITQPYCDAASARVGDMLLPTDEPNYLLQPTPIPEIEQTKEELEAAAKKEAPQAPPMPQGMPPPAPGAMPPAMPAQGMQPPQKKTPAALALEKAVAEIDRIREVAERKAKRAQKQIDDWLVECQYHAEMRKCLDDVSRLGSGVMKGPFAVKRTTRKWEKDDAGGEHILVIKEETKPASKRIDVWNLFPAPGCGENIQNGPYVWERDHLTAKRLQDLMGGVGASAYLDDQIRLALKEGPAKRNEDQHRRDQQTKSKDLFEIWYFHGAVSGEQLDAAGCECEDPEMLYPAKLTLVNDRVIKATLNPLDSGEFPYDIVRWKMRPGLPWGQGIAREGRTPQRIVTAAARALMDNAGASARPHRIMTGDVEQDGDPWTWRISDDATIQDARAAMSFFEQPSRQTELLNIINWGMAMMERVTGMPMILMGIQGDVEETAQGRTMQNNNGNSVLRRFARLFDSDLTEPHMRRYYAWLMEYVDDPEVKGDCQIVARGSSALVERDMQNQVMPQVLQMAKDPAFGMSPQKAADELLKSWRFSPKAFALSDEEKEAMKNAQPPKAPQVQAAEIREQGQTQREQMKQAEETKRLQMEIASDEKLSAAEQSIERMVAEVNAQLGQATLALNERVALTNMKATLAETAMKLRGQREMTAMKQPGQTMEPPTEPPGRAKPGLSFVQ